VRWGELEAAIEDHAWTGALALALDGWRQRRHARFADLIDILSKRSSVQDSQPIVARDSDAFQAVWLERSRRPSPADVPMLLSTLVRSLPMPREP
jgi:hypothetical protein